MTKLHVRLFLDLKEDRRTSMEIYSRELAESLGGIGATDLEVESYRPRYLAPAWMSARWADRWARYRGYPAQVRGRDAMVNHVVDHGYAHLLSTLRPERTVVTVHDMIPILSGRGLMPGATGRRPWLSEYSAGFLRRAAAIAAVSDNTRMDIVRHLGVAEDKVVVAPNGLSTRFRPLGRSRHDLRLEAGLPPDGPLLLITGTQFYKNHATSVRVLGDLRKRAAVHMVCMGALTADAARLAKDLGVEEFIHPRRPAGQDELVVLYNAVDCLLFPSLYEGFGWPPIEAMACGTPVVCSNAGALPEVVGAAALAADALDADAFVRHVEAVLADGAEAERLRRAGTERAARYSWARHAATMLETYRRVAA